MLSRKASQLLSILSQSSYNAISYKLLHEGDHILWLRIKNRSFMVSICSHVAPFCLLSHCAQASQQIKRHVSCLLLVPDYDSRYARNTASLHFFSLSSWFRFQSPSWHSVRKFYLSHYCSTCLPAIKTRSWKLSRYQTPEGAPSGHQLSVM